MRCIVISNDPTSVQSLEHYFTTAPITKVGTFPTVTQAMDYLVWNDVDLILLDATCRHTQQLDVLDPHPLRIILSDSMEEAIPLFHKDIAACVLKPILSKQLDEALVKAQEYLKFRLTRSHRDTLLIKVNGNFKRIHLNEIDFVEGMSNYLAVHCDRTKYVIYQSIKAMEETLKTDSFVRVHKSYIVNMQKITAYNATAVKIGNTQIPVGRIFKDSFREKMKQAIC